MDSLDEKLIEYASVGALGGVKRTLEDGADVHVGDDYALRLASGNGHVAVVELLLKSGANVNAMRSGALRHASKNGYVDVVELLLLHGANVDAKNNQALYWASRNGHIRVVVKLVRAGVNLRTLGKCWGDMFGCDAPDGLVEMGIEKVAELIVVEAVWRELV